jgi:hypothetical protein
MGKNCNGFNNRIRGNDKLAKALDIKEDLDIDCLLYCKRRLNFSATKTTRMTLSKCSSGNRLALPFHCTMYTRTSMQDKCKMGGLGLSVSGNAQDT